MFDVPPAIIQQANKEIAAEMKTLKQVEKRRMQERKAELERRMATDARAKAANNKSGSK